jgi:hypothetical protein
MSALCLTLLVIALTAGVLAGFIFGSGANKYYVQSLEAELCNLELGNDYMKARLDELTDRDERGRFVKRENNNEL